MVGRMSPVPPRPIGDDEELTQYGTTTEPFRNEPRWVRENAVSLLLGGWEPLAAGHKVRRHGALDDGTDAARYTSAGTLRVKGFTVEHDPGRKNPDHVRVTRLGPWDAAVCQDFDACFSEVQVDPTPREEEDERG